MSQLYGGHLHDTAGSLDADACVDKVGKSAGMIFFVSAACAKQL